MARKTTTVTEFTSDLSGEAIPDGEAVTLRWIKDGKLYSLDVKASEIPDDLSSKAKVTNAPGRKAKDNGDVTTAPEAEGEGGKTEDAPKGDEAPKASGKSK